MESKDMGGRGRADRVRTRAYAKKMQQQEQERIAATQGLSAEEYWKRYVNSAESIAKFYALYHPEYPEILAKAIAVRVSSIIDKSRSGGMLTEEEKGYIERSQAPSKAWDYQEELKQQELAAKIRMAADKLSELMCDEKL